MTGPEPNGEDCAEHCAVGSPSNVISGDPLGQIMILYVIFACQKACYSEPRPIFSNNIIESSYCVRFDILRLPILPDMPGTNTRCFFGSDGAAFLGSAKLQGFEIGVSKHPM